MDNQTTENIEQSVAHDTVHERVSVSEPVEVRKTNTTNVALIICVVFSLILGMVGTIFGILGFIKSNEAVRTLEFNNITVDEDMGDIDTGDENVAYVYVTYNDGKDFVTAGAGQIVYYASDPEGLNASYTAEADTEALKQYITDNYSNQLSDQATYVDNLTWSIDLSVGGVDYVASGDGVAPDWFNNILERLNVSQYGYLSQKVQGV